MASRAEGEVFEDARHLSAGQDARQARQWHRLRTLGRQM